MIRRPDRPSVVAVALGVGALTAHLLRVDHAVRFVVVLLFVSMGPGLSVMRLTGVRERLAWVAMVVPVSLAVGVVVSEALVIAQLWSPTAALAVLLVVCVVLAVAESPAPAHPNPAPANPANPNPANPNPLRAAR
jgi:hypothetical protein